jgi:hypothetical protein
MTLHPDRNQHQANSALDAGAPSTHDPTENKAAREIHGFSCGLRKVSPTLKLVLLFRLGTTSVAPEATSIPSRSLQGRG